MPPGGEPLVLFDGLLHEVVGLDQQVPGEGDGMTAHVGILGVVFHLEGFSLALRIVGDGQRHWTEHRHDPVGAAIQVTAQAVFQESVFHRRVRLGYADLLRKAADGGGGVATAAKAANGGHPGIIPAGDVVLFHQLAQLPLAHDGVVDTQAGELNLAGLVVGDRDVVDHPVVQGTVGLKFQGAEGVGNSLQGVLNGVGEVRTWGRCTTCRRCDGGPCV